jgi:caffeoyl-CoA O-methyltransferase
VNKAFGNAEPALEAYTYQTFAPEDDFLRDVRARQQAAGLPDIQVAALDGKHLEVLAAANGARRAVEIGTLGGYSGVCLLRGMGEGGRLDTFELDPRHAEVALETFRRAGFGDRARVHVGPALERLPDIAGDAPFDLVFVDADKTGYPAYTAWAAEHLRVGGVVLLDNAFLFGRVVLEGAALTAEHAPSVKAMRETHAMLASSGRFVSTMLPTGEGLAMGVKVL